MKSKHMENKIKPMNDVVAKIVQNNEILSKIY